MYGKLSLLFLMTLLISACVSNSLPTAKSPLRYDGVYSSETRIDGDLYCEYLRFYPEGTVITVTSECPEKDVLPDIKKWFAKENAGPDASGVSKGNTTINKNAISFDAISIEGNISYEGKILGNRISLSSFSHINQHRDHDVYQFVAW